MKLFNQFNILPRYLTAFNYAGLNLNETPKELEKCTKLTNLLINL